MVDTRLSHNSRYAGLPVETYVGPDARPVVYLARRFVPQPEGLTTIRERLFRKDERLDVVAASCFGDPTLFWRICDANRALDPATLTAEPRRLRLTLPGELS